VRFYWTQRRRVRSRQSQEKVAIKDTRLKDQIMQTQNGPVNLHAQQMSLDAEEAMSVACCR